MADVTISAAVASAQYATTFEDVDTSARVITQDGIVAINNSGRLTLEDGWLLVCESLQIDAAAIKTEPTGGVTAADGNFHLVLKNSEIRVNGGSDNNSNQLKGGRVRIRNGIIRNMSNNSSGQYALGSFEPAQGTYYDIDGLRVSGLAQRTLVQFFRANSASVIKGLVFESGHTDLNFNAGSETAGIAVNPVNADSDIGIESRDLDTANAAYDSTSTDPTYHNNGTETLTRPYQDGDTGFRVYTYFDKYVFDDQTASGNLAAFILQPRPGNYLILIDPVIRNDRGVKFVPNNGDATYRGFLDNDAVTQIEYRYRFDPIFKEGSTNISGVKVRISNSNADFDTFFEKGRLKHESGVYYFEYVEDGNINPSRWSFTEAQMFGKYYGDHTPAANNEFESGANGKFPEPALIRTRFYEATETASPEATLTKFTGNFVTQIRHYLYDAVTENRDYEDLTAQTPTYNLIRDANVTEQDKDTVDAYTEIANLDQLYDVIKSLISDYALDMTLPTRNDDGALVMTGFTLILNPSNTSMVEITPGTTLITIKSAATFAAGTKFTSLVCSSLGVSTGQTVNVTAPFSDANGRHIIFKPSVSTAQSYHDIQPSETDVPEAFVFSTATNVVRSPKTGAYSATEINDRGATLMTVAGDCMFFRFGTFLYACVRLWNPDVEVRMTSATTFVSVALATDGLYLFWATSDGEIYRRSTSNNDTTGIPEGTSAYADLDITPVSFCKAGDYWYVLADDGDIYRYDGLFQNKEVWHETPDDDTIDITADDANVYLLVGGDDGGSPAVENNRIVKSFPRGTKNGTITTVYDTGDNTIRDISITRVHNLQYHLTYADAAGNQHAIAARPGSTITITTKAYGHLFDRREVAVDTALPIIDVSLPRDSNIDTGVDLSGISDASGTGTEDRVYAEFVNASKCNLVFGEINLKGQFNKSVALLDHRMSQLDGLRFRHLYDPNNAITTLDGKIYEIRSDRIAKQAALAFTRIPGLTVTEKSLFGAFVTAPDGTTAYTAPVSNGDDVRIADLSSLNILDTPTVVDAAQRLATQQNYLQAFADATSEQTREDMQSDDYFTSLVGLSTDTDNVSSGSTNAEIAKMYAADTTAQLAPVSSTAATTWAYVLVDTDKTVDGNLLPELSLDVLGAIVSGTPGTDIGTRIELKIYALGTVPANIATHITTTTNVPVVSTTGSPKTVTIDLSAYDTKYLLVAYRSTQASDDFILSVRNLKIRHSPARGVHQSSVEISGDISGLMIPTAEEIRSEIDSNSSKLTSILADTDALPSAADVRTEMDANSTKLANLDVAVSTRLAEEAISVLNDNGLTSHYADIGELLAAVAKGATRFTSTQAGNLDAAISSRLAASGYTTPPTTAQIKTAIEASGSTLATLLSRLTAARATLLDNLDAAVTSRADASAYTAARAALLDNLDAAISSISGGGGSGPTAVAIREELERDGGDLDTLTTRLSESRAAGLARLGFLDAAVSSRLAASGYTAPTAPPTVSEISDQIERTGGPLAGVKSTTDKIGFDGDGSESDPYLVQSAATTTATPNVDFSPVNTKIDAVKTVVDAIKTETDKVQTVDDNVDAIKTNTDKLNFSGAGTTSDPYKVEADAGDVTATVDLSATNTKIDNVKTVVDAVKTETDKIQTIDDNVDSVKSTTDTNLDATVSSRLASSGYTAPTTPPTTSAIATAVQNAVERDGGMLEETQDAVDATKTTVDTNLDATVSSRLASSGYTAPTTPPTAAAIATATKTAMEADDSMLENLDDKVDAIKSQTDKIGFTGDGSSADPYLVRSGATIEGDVTATVDLSSTNNKIDAVKGVVDNIKTETDKVQTIDDNVDSVKSTVDTNLDATVSSRLATSGYTAPTTPTTPPTVAEIRAEMEKSGTKLTQLNNRLSSARAANLDDLDATISSRLAASDYTAPTTPTVAPSASENAAAVKTALEADGTKLSSAEDNAKRARIQVENTRIYNPIDSTDRVKDDDGNDATIHDVQQSDGTAAGADGEPARRIKRSS